MNIAGKYEALLQEYRQLQLRVTRFSSVEQELNKTRDKLDQELEIYKRLSNYTSLALKAKSSHELVQITVESMIDIFEIEVSALQWEEQIQGSTQFIIEGLDGLGITAKSLNSGLRTFTQDFSLNTPRILLKDELSKHSVLSRFHNGIVFKHVHPDFSFCLVGLISEANSPLYNELNARHETIFHVFTQQLIALFTNLVNKEKITNQLKIIENSKRELQTLSLIATKTNNSVLISDRYGRIEWVNSAFETISGYSLSEVIGKKPKDFLQAPDDSSKELARLKKALKEHKEVQVTVTNYNKQGEKYYNNLEILPVKDDHGELTKFISVQRDITADIESDREIRRINHRFKQITNNLNIGIWEWDIEANTLSWNSNLYQQYDVDPAEIEGRIYEFWKESIHHDDRARVESETDSILQNKISHVDSTYRIIAKGSQAERILKCSTFSEKDEEGKIIRMLGSSIDITSETKAKNNLIQSEEKYRSIIENIHLGLIEYDSKGNKVFANDRYYELTKTTKNNEFYWCKTPRRSLSKMKSEGLILNYNKLKKSTYELEVFVSRKSTRNLMVNTTSVIDPLSKEQGHIAVLVDTTNEKSLRKKLERSLLERENLIEKINSLKVFYESILNHSPTKIAVLDPSLVVNYTNKLQRLREPVWANAEGKTIYQLVEKQDDNKNPLEELIMNIKEACKEQSLKSFEQTLHSEKSDRVLLRTILPYYEKSELKHIIITSIDITELKKSEKSILAKNEALKKINSELDSFVYSVSHDLRAPLLSVKGILSLLFEVNEFDPETQQYLNMIDSSVERLDSTIQEILEYSRNSRLDLSHKPIELSSVVETIYNDIKYSSNTTVSLETEYNGPTKFFTDPSRLTTVLKNLIGNSIKYKNNAISNPFVRVVFWNDSKTIKIRIIDNGVGISEEAQKKVFEMFYRAHENSIGTGLGLYICKEIINKLNGKITLHSKRNVGTQIEIIIPLK